jgi:tRNA G18 (ribose-2'-O)-methylase SpoU
MLATPPALDADTSPMTDTTQTSTPFHATQGGLDPRLVEVENCAAPGMRPDSARNVIDRFKEWTTEQIAADLETRRTELVSVAVNLGSDFNKASIIRANNAFTGRKVIITERRRYNKTGTVGTHHYEHVEYIESTLEAIAGLIAEGYTVYPVDNTPEFEPRPVLSVALPKKTAFLYGEEGNGLPSSVVSACNGVPVYIPQYGSVRSINVAQCAAIMFQMYDLAHPRDHLFAEPA